MAQPQAQPELQSMEHNMEDAAAEGVEKTGNDLFGNWFSGNQPSQPQSTPSLAPSPTTMPASNHPSLSPLSTSLVPGMSALRTSSASSTPTFPGQWQNPFDQTYNDGRQLASHILQYHDPANTHDHIRPCIADNPNVLFNNCPLPRIDENAAFTESTDFFTDLTFDCDFEVHDQYAFTQHVLEEHRMMNQAPWMMACANAMQPGFVPPMPSLPAPLYNYQALPEPGRCHSLPGSGTTDISYQHSVPGTPLRAPTPSAPTDCDCPDDHGPDELSIVDLDRKLSTPTAGSGDFKCLWSEYDGLPCDKTFETAAALHEHCKDSHTKSAEKRENQYWCKWAGCIRDEGFSQRAKLERHLQTHSGFKPAQCPVCKEWFSATQALKQHMRTHNGETPWSCTWPGCEKVFKQQSALTMHMRTHTGQKPLECDICGKRFSESSNLSKHRRTHNSQGLYNCELCGKHFHRRDQMRRHMKTNHKDRMELVDEILSRPLEKNGGRKGRSGVSKNKHYRTPSLSMSRAESPSLSPSLKSTPPDTVLDNLPQDALIAKLDLGLPSGVAAELPSTTLGDAL